MTAWAELLRTIAALLWPSLAFVVLLMFRKDSNVFSQAWYRDPESGSITTAWRSSMEFVGRHLDDIWKHR